MIGRLPVRWRLTLWYMALTTLVLVVFSIAVYIGLQRRLSDNLDDDLRSQAALASASVTFGSGGAILASEEELSDEAVLKLINLIGKVEYSNQRRELEDIPVHSGDVDRALEGRVTFRTIHTEGQTIRAITVPIENQSGFIVGALLMGMSTSRIEDALDLLMQALFVIAPIAIALAALTGYMIAGRALRPVSDITRLAGQIGGNDLHSRLNLDLPDDELGRLASTFDLMLGRIDESFQRQRQFTGDAAHELRTPLALMRSQIDLALTQADTSEEFREALRALDGDVGRMTVLVGTLLSLARADAGTLNPSREPVDLAELANDVCEQYAPIASQNGQNLTCELNPVVVLADADMIIQVVVNLLDNAVKNTPAGNGITVQTKVSRSRFPVSRTEGEVAALETGNGKLETAVIEVTDTGIGIAPEHLPRIFDRFYRVDTGRARAEGGIGLGLAISQAIARVHGGTLTATSEPGKGSTFTLMLPMSNTLSYRNGRERREERKVADRN